MLLFFFFSCGRRFRLQFYTVSEYENDSFHYETTAGEVSCTALTLKRCWRCFAFKQLAQILMNMHNKYHTLTFIVECFVWEQFVPFMFPQYHQLLKPLQRDTGDKYKS